MTDGALQKRKAFAEAVAREAAALALDYYQNRDRLQTKLKGFQDFLTVADGEVEALLRRRVADAFPGDGFLGEEGGGEGAERLWIVDPIDGTANFARGDLHWCISIGYAERNRPVLGVVAAPSLGETFSAGQGGGATLNGKPITVAPTAEMRSATIEIGWSARLPAKSYLDLVARVMSLGAAPKRSASGALGMCWTAAGRTDAYLEMHINSWDVAAGTVIAREAGALVNEFFSGDGLRKGNPILVATPTLAGPLADAMGLSRSDLV
ncbi:MAG: inositol monophosphatase [Hyphomicrobiaceae bacterium]|nr:MAG: inositol monophosphatase [Hyphomicrobiaceae bacterium]